VDRPPRCDPGEVQVGNWTAARSRLGFPLNAVSTAPASRSNNIFGVDADKHYPAEGVAPFRAPQLPLGSVTILPLAVGRRHHPAA